MGEEVLRWAVVDAGGVDADGCHLSFDQRPSCLFGDAWEVEIGGVAEGVIAEILLGVGPVSRPAGVYQDDGAGFDRAVSLLERVDVRDGEEGVAVFGGGGGHVDDDARGDESFEWYLVGGVLSLGEVDRCVEVSAAVLRRRDGVGRVEVPTLGVPVKERFLLETGGRGRPVDRVLVIGVREVDETARGRRGGGRRRRAGACGRDEERVSAGQASFSEAHEEPFCQKHGKNNRPRGLLGAERVFGGNDPVG